ncbi:MAG: PHP domain-containing protein [Lentisphaerae bacterium]|jgi:hypothetical protein|nr:PHP domain-containing protein [Lentisphaerota bacterium]
MQHSIAQLNAPGREERLNALRHLKKMLDGGSIARPSTGKDVNNHIHTTFSFSPYSPSKAVWFAYMAGLSTAGIMDHDSVGGVREFIEAGDILKLPVTIGAEVRASFDDTQFDGRKINNPDQDSCAYLALHGIPHSRIDVVAAYLEPLRMARAVRNRKMTDNLNRLLSPAGISIDYDRDVVPLSEWENGGEVTERHLLYAVAGKLIGEYGIGAELVGTLRETLEIDISQKVETKLADSSNPYVRYDLLGVLKGEFVEKFYVKATDECPHITDLAKFAKENGIILAYAYLGDIEESVTGDKKAQKCEDEYLDELIEYLVEIGFDAVTYMPSRNTRAQLVRLRALCEKHGLFQISGEDINQPTQKFICKAMRDPFFSNLYDAAWALIGHERLATEDISKGLFSSETKLAHPDLDYRIATYRDAAKSIMKNE